MVKLFIVACLFFLSFAGKAQHTNPNADTAIFSTIDKEATFVGGPQAWKKYIEKSLKKRMKVVGHLLKQQQIKVLSERVVIEFVIDKNGKITEVEAINTSSSINKILADESIIIIQNSPLWEPAYQNKLPVKFRQRQSITWSFSQ